MKVKEAFPSSCVVVGIHPESPIKGATVATVKDMAKFYQQTKLVSEEQGCGDRPGRKIIFVISVATVNDNSQI